MTPKNVVKSIRSYIQSLSVRRQFFFAGSLSIGLLLCLCIYGIIQLDATNRQTSRLTNIDIPALKTTNSLYIKFLKINSSTKNPIQDNIDIITNIDREFKTLIKFDLTIAEFEKLQILQHLWKQYKAYPYKHPHIITDIEISIINLQNIITEEARLRSIKVGDLFSITRQRFFILLVCGTAIISIFYYFLTRKFLAPLNQGLGLVRAMQRGDLSARINIYDNNEIGTLCQALNKACVALEEKARQEAEQNEKIYQANKLISLGTLVAGVAHEINNPNSNITFNTPLLFSLLGDLFETIDEFNIDYSSLTISEMEFSELQNNIFGMVDTIEKSAYRIKSIIEGLRDYSRPVVEPHTFVQIEITELLTTTFELIGKQFEKSIQHLDLSIPDTKIFIQGNFIRLEQVLVNILNNAKEAMYNISNSCLRVYVKENETTVSIIVQDNGIGIKSEIMNQITDPFFTTKRSINGTGLGLSVVASILAEHQADIKFLSEPDNGTTVIITFLKDN